jgi:hypothetical protein
MNVRALTLAIVALVLAFAVVEGTSFLQNPPAAAVMKGESVTEASARLQADQPDNVSSQETLTTVILGPLAIAGLCYVLVRKRT